MVSRSGARVEASQSRAFGRSDSIQASMLRPAFVTLYPLWPIAFRELPALEPWALNFRSWSQLHWQWQDLATSLPKVSGSADCDQHLCTSMWLRGSARMGWKAEGQQVSEARLSPLSTQHSTRTPEGVSSGKFGSVDFHAR